MFWQSLRNASFSASKSSRNGACATQNWREHSIKDSLASNQGHISSQLFNDRSRLSDGPFVTHRVFSLFTVKLQLKNFLMNVVLTSRSNVGDSSSGFGRNHDAVFREKTVFVDCSENISLTDDITLLETWRLEFPEFFRVKWRHINSLGNEDGLWDVSNDLEGSLDPVENLIENTRSEFNRERLLGSLHRVSNSESSWI